MQQTARRTTTRTAEPVIVVKEQEASSHPLVRWAPHPDDGQQVPGTPVTALVPVRQDLALPPMPEWLSGAGERQLADHLLMQVGNRLNPQAKPFCIFAGARPGENFYVHRSSAHGWLVMPYGEADSFVPDRAKFILEAVCQAGYPLMDIRVAREVVTPPFQCPDFSAVLQEDFRRMRDAIARMRDAAADMAESFFTPCPVLAVRIGRSHWIELYRWNL
jgi:hypothetical protein